MAYISHQIHLINTLVNMYITILLMLDYHTCSRIQGIKCDHYQYVGPKTALKYFLRVGLLLLLF